MRSLKENFRKKSKSPFQINKKSIYGVMEIILSELKNIFIAKLNKEMTKEKRVLKYVLSKGRKNDPENVLEIIDECGYKKFFLMNIGDKKGQILEEYIISSKAKNILELGLHRKKFNKKRKTC